jgi:hypothetical protein
MFPLFILVRGQITIISGQARMLIAEHLAIDGQCLAVALFALNIISLRSMKRGQIVIAGGCVWMLFTESLAADGQGCRRAIRSKLGKAMQL